MSIMYCEKHDRRWDSDRLEMCPICENEPVGEVSEKERILLAALKEQRVQMDFHALPEAFALTMKRMIDKALTAYEGEGK